MKTYPVLNKALRHEDVPWA